MPPRKRKILSGNCNGTTSTNKITTNKKPKKKDDTPVETERRSSRSIKKKNIESDDDEAPKNVRSCEKVGCDALAPVCRAEVAEKCAGTGYTSRWYHISLSEHFCNECFEYFYRSNKAGYKQWCEWKQKWSSNSKTEPSLKTFISDYILSFWVQCTKSECRKWRKLPRDVELSSKIISGYKCDKKVEGFKKNSNCCATPESEIVDDVNKPAWMEQLLSPPYFKSSPAASFVGAYFPEGVGISPTCEQSIAASKAYQEWRKQNSSTTIGEDDDCTDSDYPYQQNIPGLSSTFHPFYQPDETGKAMCIRPDVMEPDEILEFPQFTKDHSVKYLGIRNIIIALWNMNCKKWLTLSTVASHLICRGLVRIYSVHLADRIIKFLTRKGTINFGLLPAHPESFLLPPHKKETVIVVGAGVSGLCVARQLQSFGCEVTILEGRNRIGGRVCDDMSVGKCVGRGAQIVTGVINNPFTLICHQADIALRILEDKCDLFDSQGKIVDGDMDHKMEIHFNTILDAVAKWRNEQTVDVSLYDQLMEFSRQKQEHEFSREELALLNFHISNLEYACGSVLSNVSALHWDQNEEFPQFYGQHGMLPGGYTEILVKLSEGLSIKLNQKANSINYSGDKVYVETDDNTYIASKVIVTVPLALLQKDTVNFKPPLPDKKLQAIRSLGSGIIEKIVLQFPHRFWDSKLLDADYFGNIPVSPSEKGLFSVFYDMTPENRTNVKGPHVLMTYVTGDAVKIVEQNSADKVISCCMEVLRRIFSDDNVTVPDPIKYFVTNWRNDPFAQMSYSYVKVGGTGEAYDAIAECIENKVFFAGEATNRQYPQTVTGAYMSGLREANKITKLILR